MGTGIYTLANDRVLDQVIALLNSIEVIAGTDMPVCILPYDDQVSALREAIRDYPQVQLFQDTAIIEKWDRFAQAIWDCHPTAKQTWIERGWGEGYHRFGTHRRYCGFDGPFEKFIYMDADTVLLSPVESIFAQLDSMDWVVYDFQYKDPSHVYSLESPRLHQVFAPERIEREIFCSGFYATKRNVFTEETLTWLVETLRSGEAEILYPMAPDQTILNYMVMRSQISSCNLVHVLGADQRTGNSVTSPHFEVADNLVYDHGKRLTYLHYIGISSKHFAALTQGENVDFPYRDVFFHYRFLKHPEQRPTLAGQPKSYKQPPLSLKQRVFRKLGLTR